MHGSSTALHIWHRPPMPNANALRHMCARVNMHAAFVSKKHQLAETPGIQQLVDETLHASASPNFTCSSLPAARPGAAPLLPGAPVPPPGVPCTSLLLLILVLKRRCAVSRTPDWVHVVVASRLADTRDSIVMSSKLAGGVGWSKSLCNECRKWCQCCWWAGSAYPCRSWQEMTYT
jgi:hypothetical protein